MVNEYRTFVSENFSPVIAIRSAVQILCVFRTSGLRYIFRASRWWTSEPSADTEVTMNCCDDMVIQKYQ